MVGRQYHILSVEGYELTHYGLRSLELMCFSSCRECKKISICFGIPPFSLAFLFIYYYRDKGKYGSYICNCGNIIHKIEVLDTPFVGNDLTNLIFLPEILS